MGPPRFGPALALALLAGLLASACATLPIYRYRPQLTEPGADLLAALTVASGNEAVDGNAVVLLENGARAFPAMLEAIRSATSSVHLETFIFRDGEIGRSFVDALAERARGGVKVRLLLDAIGSSGFGAENTKRLQEAGARVVFFRPPSLASFRRSFLRTHRKILIVDGGVGFTGVACIDDAWTGDADRSDHWRDTEVRVEGPVVRQMQASFARTWLEATGDLLSARDLYPDLPDSGDVNCQVMDSTPAASSNPARLSFLISVAGARHTIDATIAYFVPDREARRALESAARRGVRVRLLLPGRNTDLPTLRFAGRTEYGALLRAGVEIYEYQPARLHAKTLVVDGRWASIGSANIDHRSFRWNYESNLNVFDEAFAAEMESMFERDLARSLRVSLEEWTHRPCSERLREWFSGLFRAQY